MATAVVKAEQTEAQPACINQILAARLRNRWIMASTPSTRHLLDGVEVPVPHRSTEPARPRFRREMTLRSRTQLTV